MPADAPDSRSQDIPNDAAGRPWRILLADDAADQRKNLAEMLRTAGYEVDEAADGRSALVLLEHRPVDLLLLDLSMPGDDGFDVLAYLQQHRPGLPVILLSGLAPDEIQHSMHRLPLPELPPLLLKPVDPDHLLEVVAMKLVGELPG